MRGSDKLLQVPNTIEIKTIGKETERMNSPYSKIYGTSASLFNIRSTKQLQSSNLPRALSKIENCHKRVMSLTNDSSVGGDS